ncbi:hypothetical protein [Nonomuraea basaltis]|uniref:hypothetical protein n=1 Tax=Nonomuraea basaltis TaxID=2495887 RepID=UPI001487247B|nr:hypothetical protein [Nonomuraea basaltis]TMR89129.1 hypothetical protein EJK15_62425 [Nonomuraea basaltis]
MCSPTGRTATWGRSLFGLLGVPAQAELGFLAQLTQQAAPVGIVLVVRCASGSLALAGLAAAAFSVGAGMGRPVQGGSWTGAAHGPGSPAAALADVPNRRLDLSPLYGRRGGSGGRAGSGQCWPDAPAVLSPRAVPSAHNRRSATCE